MSQLKPNEKGNKTDQKSSVFVGRQAIYAGDLKTYAYELLFRSSEMNFADVTDGESATAQLLMNAFTEIGLDRLVGDAPAFINVPESFLLLGHCSVLPIDRVVIEVLEDTRPTPEVLAAIKKLKTQGYTIALDDFVLGPELLPLVALADIVKVELPAISQDDLPRHVEQLRKFNLRLLSEKVESAEEFEFCKSLGFDYYQGYFFSRPSVVSGKKLPSNRLAMVRLIAQLQDPEVDFEEVVEIIQAEPAIAIRLLRFANSASMAMKRKIESIRHAATMAGLSRIKTIGSLVALSELGNEKPKEVIQMVLIRAKMAELLAYDSHLASSESAFLTGLFSGLEIMLNVPLADALEMASISEAIREAVNSRAGDLGMILNCVLNYEIGDWDNVSCGDLSNAKIRKAYLKAIEWSNEAMLGI